MAMFREISAVVQAIQIQPGKERELLSFLKKTGTPYEDLGGSKLAVYTQEGIITMHPGDWLVCNELNEKHAYKPGAFTTKYEPV